MSIAARIAELEKELEALKVSAEKGYVVYDIYEADYDITERHTFVEDADGNFAGVVVNYDVMKKYFKEME